MSSAPHTYAQFKPRLLLFALLSPQHTVIIIFRLFRENYKTITRGGRLIDIEPADGYLVALCLLLLSSLTVLFSLCFSRFCDLPVCPYSFAFIFSSSSLSLLLRYQNTLFPIRSLRNRWCEYIFYRNLQKLGEAVWCCFLFYMILCPLSHSSLPCLMLHHVSAYCRISRSTLSDTELQMAKFLITGAIGTEKHAKACVYWVWAWMHGCMSNRGSSVLCFLSLSLSLSPRVFL